MKISIIGALAAAVVLAAPAVRAADATATAAAPVTLPAANEADIQALRAAMRGDKRAYVAGVLSLTPAEAKKFWPIYDAYQRAVDAANRRRAVALEELLSTDKPMSNPAARNLARELLAADDQETRARRAMFNAVMRALPQVKAARYIQLENKIATVQAYDIAAAFPLVK
ncbi:MAG: hypothetical protein JSR18_07850 [Proteobacteria bacterium]|nr:hypothetical protein [Pseudomonadota bacterium]